MKRLTANERYLLEIILHLRGEVYDLWGRLHAIATRKETIRSAAPIDEMAELVKTLSAQRSGAHLPHPNDTQLSSAMKHYLIGAHARSARAGETITHVNQLKPRRPRKS